ncbi:HNH endonuclease [Gimesia panareensis]|uniref:HNH endonuclease n=1 Tax=Gimesia panareensis TaxID=2527978 RepID=UPI0036F36E56
MLSGRIAGTPSGYTWHHHEVIGIMQLVRKDVHKALFGGHRTHHGGVFFWELLNNKKYKK